LSAFADMADRLRTLGEAVHDLPETGMIDAERVHAVIGEACGIIFELAENDRVQEASLDFMVKVADTLATHALQTARPARA